MESPQNAGDNVARTTTRARRFDFHVAVFKYSGHKPWYAEPKKHPEERVKLVEHCMDLLTKLKDGFTFGVTPLSTSGITEWLKCTRPEFVLKRTAEDHEKIRELDVFHAGGKLEADVYVDHGDPAGNAVSARSPPNHAPWSDAGRKTIRNWIAACKKEHGDACKLFRKQGAGSLPAKLVEIGSIENKRLCETSPGERYDYATLSYCWGEIQSLCTTSTTLHGYIQRILYESLPKTIQNAVLVTVELGLRYLWVDSLCIVQDDEEDRVREIGKMANIYRYSYVTISAACGDSVDQGFLEREDGINGNMIRWPSLIPLAYFVPNKNAKNPKKALTMPFEVKGQLLLDDEAVSYRSSVHDSTAWRAWCLQERILSPRIISYGRWPTWRCSEATWSDGGYYSEEPETKSTDKLTSLLSDPRILYHNELDFLRNTQLYIGWYRLLSDYTRRKLTHEADYLPAIGGIAASISLVTGAKYVAGLWSNNLLHDLMWTAQVREWLNRPPEWRAPTWSWAAIQASVTYEPNTDDVTAIASIISYQSEPKSAMDPFGAVAASQLTIRGPLAELDRNMVANVIETQLMMPPPPSNGDVQGFYRQILEAINATARNMPAEFSKEDGLAALPDRVYGLVLFTRDWTEKHEEKLATPCYFGLILKASESEPGRFERIGAFKTETAAWVNQRANPCGMKEIVIV